MKDSKIKSVKIGIGFTFNADLYCTSGHFQHNKSHRIASQKYDSKGSTRPPRTTTPPLPSGPCRISKEAGDDVDITESVVVANKDAAGLHEVLVGLEVVELADDRPDKGEGSEDMLSDGRATLVRAEEVSVVGGHGGRRKRVVEILEKVMKVGGVIDCLEEEGRRIGRI
ncbi:hypothetical protein G2W53_022939 [Senna tora]|uniref:Uncharacterized protein n=1 Tax=Senna tora TaxID=362788 RepID=A0A834WIS7_9FABA|nr:hypothetical protein G2W53_022939 [Senna tora]